MQRASGRELAERRAEAVAAVRAVAPLRFVNGGGTGSIEQTASEPVVTEVGGGLGALRSRRCSTTTGTSGRGPRPTSCSRSCAAPPRGIATALGGGWIASGPPGQDRLPTIAYPTGLRMNPQEGAGEVQTPLLGAAAAQLRLGDRVWMRHSKAGELCERVNELHLVSGGTVVDVVPTYRGEGHAFL